MTEKALMKTETVKDAPRQQWIQFPQIPVQHSDAKGDACDCKPGPDRSDVVMGERRPVGESFQPAGTAGKQKIEQGETHAGAFESKTGMMTVKAVLQGLRE